MKALSVVIPAYNEEEGIADIVERVLSTRPARRAAGADLELIVVDDGSHDLTAEIVTGYPDVCVGTIHLQKGERADIYALGCVLYELLTGQQTVARGFHAGLMQGHCDTQWQRLPAGVRELVTCYLAVEPGIRHEGWEALKAVLEHEERGAVGWYYIEIGIAYLNLGKAWTALDYFEQARAVGAQEGKRRLEAAALTHLGTAYASLGEARWAIGCYEQAQAILHEIGGRWGEVAILLGTAYVDWGKPNCYRRARVAEAEEGAHWLEAKSLALTYLGTTCADLGEARWAIGCYEQAQAILHEIRDRQGEGEDLRLRILARPYTYNLHFHDPHVCVGCYLTGGQSELSDKAERQLFWPLRLWDFAWPLSTTKEDAALIPLRFLLDYSIEYLTTQEVALPLGFFRRVLEAGGTSVPLGGMDDVASPDFRCRMTLIVELFARLCAANRFLVTSRIVGYQSVACLDEDYSSTTVRDFDCAVPERFGPNQILANSLLAAITNNVRERKLVVNFLVFVVVALVYRYRANPLKWQAEFYDRCVKVPLG